MVKKFRLDEFGYEIEIGKVAQQADGAAWLQHGGTVVLATAVMASSKNFLATYPLLLITARNFLQQEDSWQLLQRKSTFRS